MGAIGSIRRVLSTQRRRCTPITKGKKEKDPTRKKQHCARGTQLYVNGSPRVLN